MTAGELQKLGAESEKQARLVEGLTDQLLLRGVVAAADTSGRPPATNTHLIRKLRNMDTAQLALIRGTGNDPDN